MSSHIFFCFEMDCSNTTTWNGATCYDCCEARFTRDYPANKCPDCGDMGATVLGSNYCHECYSRRNHPCNAPPAADGWCPECDMYTVVLPNICTKCQEKRDNRCTCDDDTERSCAPCDRRTARRLADAAEYDVWCGLPEPTCTCDGSGRMCDFCAEEYAEPCRGCGVPSQLWTDNTYCRTCYVERHGDEFPPLPPSPEPRYTSLQSMRDEIFEIEERLKSNMTKGQKDDWIWLLQNRRGDLASAEKEMWAGYDEDDLRKLDLQLRR
jgi:hypothetical protein